MLRRDAYRVTNRGRKALEFDQALQAAIRRALGVATELNILPMVAALISGRSFKTPANAVDKVSGTIIAQELALLRLSCPPCLIGIEGPRGRNGRSLNRVQFSHQLRKQRWNAGQS